MLIAIAGLPGTGKSALARGLAPPLGAALLDKDPIRAALFAPADVEHSTNQDDFCMGIILQVAGYLWERDPHRAVILDGRPFSKRYQRIEVARFASDHGVPFKLIECRCPEHIALERIERDALAGTHPAGNRDASLYLALKANFEPLEEPHLAVDTAADYDASLQQCLRYINGGLPLPPASDPGSAPQPSSLR